MREFDACTFRRELIEHAKPAVVEFHAPWCVFSRLLGPKMRRIEACVGARWLVGRLDVALENNFAHEIGVEFVPGLAIYFDGVRQSIWYGDPPMGAVVSLLDGLSLHGGDA